MKKLSKRFILDTFKGITIIQQPTPKPDKVDDSNS